MGSVPLNGEQMHAVATMCRCSRGRKPLALFGPPGTGKTVTLVEMVLQVRGPPANSFCAALSLYSSGSFPCLYTRLVTVFLPQCLGNPDTGMNRTYPEEHAPY